ncbi:MAG: fatty acyl-AMP ligase, partial [bacterium]|nr:fatty acyl-AMP ligase [bacterium]
MRNRETETLIDLLETRAAKEPGRVAFTFHNDPPCTFGVLWQRIDEMAAHLLQQGLKANEPVIIAIPNSSTFFFAFYGVQRAGGIAVPVFPGSGPERLLKLADLCSARLMVVSKENPPKDAEGLKQRANQRGGKILWVEDSRGSVPDRPFPAAGPGDISFIQFTSGSVGNPKGVQLTHADLMTNIKQMIAGMEITTEDVFVSWLPVYHDMGLILMTMVPLYLGLGLTLLPAGLNYLKTWLKTIEEKKGTFTAAPDFAYRLCLIYIRESERYDLSDLRVALNAAEPVRSNTILRFEERFGLGNAMVPAYGLAEATVGVCCWKPGEKVKVDGRGFVSVGSPFPGVQMKIKGDGQITGDGTGEIGEIMVKSSANTTGYYQNPRATKELFDPAGYLGTGDLGYVDDDGHWFIVGRKKNMIIQGGFNIASREVEELTDEFSFVRRSAAVGIDRGKTGGEQVTIFMEVNLDKTQLQNQEVLSNITVEAVQRFFDAFGFRPGRVVLLKPGSIPMTYNGKIKYLQLKEDYIKGTLREQG